jgi:hypothetical protein
VRRRKTDCGGWASRYGPCGGCDSCCPGQEDAARQELAELLVELDDALDAVPRDAALVRQIESVIADLRDEIGPDPDEEREPRYDPPTHWREP